MTRVLALATNTFREAVRDRILYSILFFAVGVVLFSVMIQEITIGDQDKVVRSVAQGAIDLFGSIIAMFLGVSLVWKEIERKTIYTILSKPIPRWMFVLGKYLGLMLTLAVEVAVLTVLYTLVMGFEQGFPPPIVYVSMIMLLVQLGLLTAWATLFSSYSSPSTAAAFTLAVFTIGHLADDIWLFGSKLDNPGLRQTAQALYWALPNLSVLSLRPQAVHGLDVPWAQAGASLLYGLLYTAAVLGLAMAVFQRRDLR